MNVETTILQTFSLPTSKALTPTHYLTHLRLTGTDSPTPTGFDLLEILTHLMSRMKFTRT